MTATVDPIQRIPAGAVPLKRGEFARFAYRLGREGATGVLTVYAAARRPEVLILRRGQLMAQESDALGRRSGRRLSLLTALSHARYTFARDVAAYPPGAARRQFSLMRWARGHFEAQLDAATAQTLVVEFTGRRLYVSHGSRPPAALCDTTDLRILEALAQPRRLDQVWHHARTPRFRLLAFLHFLRCIDALEIRAKTARERDDRPAPQAEARLVLGVGSQANAAQVKRAYHRMVRAVHPDLHPEAGPMRRRALEHRLVAITDAYAQLKATSAVQPASPLSSRPGPRQRR